MPSTGLEETCSRRSSSGMSNPSSAYWTAASTERLTQALRLTPGVGGLVQVPRVELRERGRDDHEHSRRAARRPELAREHDLGELHRPMGRVVRVHAGQEQVVRRQIDDHGVERRVRLQRHRQEGQPVPVRFERDVEHGRAAVLPFLDHVDVVAELALQDAGPSVPSSQALLRRGLVAPGVRVAVAEDRGHVTPRCRSARSPRLRSACPARRPSVLAIVSTTS